MAPGYRFALLSHAHIFAVSKPFAGGAIIIPAGGAVQPLRHAVWVDAYGGG